MKLKIFIMIHQIIYLHIEDLKIFLINKENFFNFIQNEETITVMIYKMKRIKKLLEIIIEIIIENNFEKIIKESIDIYYKLFIFQIKKLIEEFPLDYTNKDGSLFWSGSKRFPRGINFNINESYCFNVVKYFSILLAKSIKVKLIENDNCIKKIVEKFKKPDITSSNSEILSKEEELNEINT